MIVETTSYDLTIMYEIGGIIRKVLFVYTMDWYNRFKMAIIVNVSRFYAVMLLLNQAYNNW